MDKILIIDDAWDDVQFRSKVYQEVLSENFELTYINSGANFNEQVQQSNSDLILLDIVLSGLVHPKTGGQISIFDSLAIIGKEKPIILISSEYKNLLEEGRLTKLMNHIIDDGFNNVKGFLLWADFENVVISKSQTDRIAIISKINLEIQRNRKELANESNKNFNFGIIAALEMELMPFINRIKKEGKITDQFHDTSHNFYIGEFNTIGEKRIKFIASHQSRMGMTDCALLTASMINKYKLDYIFMIGVCGGRPSIGVKIGDVVIPNKAIAYQDGKLDVNTFAPDISDAPATAALYNIVPLDFLNEKCKELHNQFDLIFKDNNKGVGLNIHYPNIHRSEMACGDQIINRPNVLDEIATKAGRRNLCSVDMESYAILRTTFLNGKVKGGVIKCVMDITQEKEDHYKIYAANLSANLLFEIIYSEKFTL